MCVLGSSANQKQVLNISSLLQKCLQCFCVNLRQPVSSQTCFRALHSHLCLRFPKSKIDDPIPALTACLLLVWVKKASHKLSSYLACRLKRWWIRGLSGLTVSLHSQSSGQTRERPILICCPFMTGPVGAGSRGSIDTLLLQTSPILLQW